MNQALENIKVLDLTRVLAGPYATMILADMGADVIKVEMPNTGDDSRAYGPYLDGESAYFMSLNRNKRSITMNLKLPESKEIFFKLVKEADVVVENYRPGTMEKLGLGYDKLKEANPKIIYAAASGFGHTGPYSQRPAYDAIVQAMGGIMSITGMDEATRVGASIGDITAGLFTAIGILAAINYRNETGRGQKVDVSMLDCQVAILENAISRYFATGISPKPLGNRHASITPFETFKTADDDIMIAAGNDILWEKLCQAMGLCDLAKDERFASNPLRTENYEELKPILDKNMKKKTRSEWIEILNKYGIPNGPINDIQGVVNDPQIVARDMIVEVEHPKGGGRVNMAGIPIKMSETQGNIRKTAPLLGEDTEEILKTIVKMNDDEIRELKEKGGI